MPVGVQAVVLDFDGVVSQSMQQHAEAYRRLLAPHGIDVRDEDVFALEGARSESIIRQFMEGAGQAPDASEVKRLGAEKQRIFRGLGTPRPYPDAPAMVRRLRDAARLALVTGTRRENVEAQVPDLLPLFDAVLAQDSYTHDKPHPEPYRTAAERLGLPAASCVVVENAVRGIQSARAAGCGHIVALTTTMPADTLREAGADVVVDGHAAAAKAVLQRLGGPKL